MLARTTKSLSGLFFGGFWVTTISWSLAFSAYQYLSCERVKSSNPHIGTQMDVTQLF